ncbi:MAG TPA: hypothetical protein VFZ77_17505 [Acidimicrobiales bacterium]
MEHVSPPAVLLAHAARVTSTLRLGSGGVMLPSPGARLASYRLVAGAAGLGAAARPGDRPVDAPV